MYDICWYHNVSKNDNYIINYYYYYSMLVFLSIITLLIWILTGGVLASTIVLSDICINPDGLIRNNTNNDPIAKGIVLNTLL